MEQKIQLPNGLTLEIKVNESDNACTTISQKLIGSNQQLLSKTCTVTCGSGSSAKSYSWTCADDKDCEGDCSDPNNPTGRCV